MSDNGCGRPPAPMKKLLDHLDPHLLARIRLQLAVTQSLRRQLPEPLGERCWCSHIEGATLTVSVDDNHQAPLIHYQQRELLKQINAEFKDRLNQPLRQLRIQVAARQAGHD